MKIVFFRSEEVNYLNGEFSSSSSYIRWLENISNEFSEVVSINPCMGLEPRKKIKCKRNLYIKPLPKLNGYLNPIINIFNIIKSISDENNADYIILRIPDHANIILLFFLPFFIKKGKIVFWVVGNRMQIAKSSIKYDSMYLLKYLTNYFIDFFEQLFLMIYPSLVNGSEAYHHSKSIHGSAISNNDANQFISTNLDNESSPVIRYLGRLTREKNIETFIKSVPFVNDPNVTFELIGRTPDQAYLDELKSLIPNNHKARVSFKNEITYGDQLFSTYATSYLIVQPSLTEGASRTILESLAFNIPVIASDIKANRYLIDKENKISLTFEAGNHEDLAKKINSCIQNKELYNNMRSNLSKESFMYNDQIAKEIKNFLVSLGLQGGK